LFFSPLLSEAQIPPAPAAAPAKQPEPVTSATRPGPQIEMDFAPRPEKTAGPPARQELDPAHRAQFQQRDPADDFGR
jgi:hypothetical protein